MAKKLVIVESPTKVKSITKFLGKDYIVMASMGHVRDLPRKKFAVDTENDFNPEYVIIPKSRKIVAKLRKTADKVDTVYLAPDPDREGEAIAWHLSELLTKKKKVNMRRVSFNEITREGILKAFKKPGRIDYNRVEAQQARRILDRIVGYKLSPLLWRKVRRGLSAGRVQSVAVRLLCERQEEIDNFKAQEYWSLEALLLPQNRQQEQFKAMLDKLNGSKAKIGNKQEAEKITADLKDKDYVVSEIKKREKKRNPGPPFNTSLMQQAAFNRLGFTAHKTMMVAQQLYEGIDLGKEGSVGLITYMRTDAFRVAKGAQEAARKYVKNKYGEEYLPQKPPKYKAKKTAQEAHEAIRPTYVEFEPMKIKEYLTADQCKLYNLIWNRFVASQMISARTAVTTVLISAGNALFRASGTEVIFAGFLAVYQDEEAEEKKEEKKLPKLDKEEKLTLLELIPEQHFTKPPPYYTEATLIKMLEEKGIGRPSTYAPIIYTIIRRDYVGRENRRLVPTDMGKHVNAILVERFSDIMDVEFTARMENELDDIEKGKLTCVKVLKGFYKPFINDLNKADEEMKRMPLKPIPTEYKCPECKKPLVIRTGRYGQFLACSGFPECKHTEPLPTGVPCPQPECNGTLVHRRSGKGRNFYGCSNYPKCTFTTNSLKKYQDVEE